jgi:type I restriction enzyme, S subunit
LSLVTPRKGYKIVTNFFRNEIQIPKEWEYPKFNQIVKTNPITKIEEKQVPYIPMDAVDTEKPHFNYFEERELSENSSLSKFQNNDTLFARITPSTENGKTCIVENFERNGIVSSELTVLRATENIIPKYLYYYVKSHRIRQFAISQMLGTTGRQRVPDYVFKKDLNIELPSLPEQKQIATILSNVDSLIDSTENVITHSKKVKTGLMQKLLTRGIGHTKFKKVPWLFGKEIEIPEEWKIVELKNLLLNQNSGLHNKLEKSEEGDNIVGMYDLYNVDKIDGQKFTLAKFPKTIKNKIVEKEKYLFDKNDLVYIEISLVKEGIGKTVYVTKNGKGTFFAGNLRRFKINDMEIFPEYLYQYLNTNMIRNYFISTSYTSAQTGITTKDYFKVRIIMSPLPEQQKIATILSNIDSKITSQEQYKEKLERLKKSLMQKLLTGEVRV